MAARGTRTPDSEKQPHLDRDECFRTLAGANRAAALATFRVLAKGDLDADAALASGAGCHRRRGR